MECFARFALLKGQTRHYPLQRAKTPISLSLSHTHTHSNTIINNSRIWYFIY